MAESYELGGEHKDINSPLKAVAVCSAGVKKVIIDGNFSVSIPTYDFRYKDEIQLQVWSNKFEIRDRGSNSGDGHRVEIFLPKSSIAELRRLLEEVEKVC
jgi:hypothetical protein